MTLAGDIRAQFADAGVRGWLHAVPVPHDAPGTPPLGGATGGAAGPRQSPAEVAVDADEPVVMALVYKLPLLVAFCRAVDAGHLDPAAPVRLTPAERTPGLTGTSAMADPVVMSRRDLARSMIAVSDNAAGDALLDSVGLDGVQEALTALDVRHTRMTGGTRDVFRQLAQDTGELEVQAAHARLTDNDRPVRSEVFDPLLASATTARDMTTLLTAIWTDNAATPQQCRFMREVLGQQIWPHRLASGFSYPGVRVAGKTGTFGALRHEVGVVHHQHEQPIAVAVLTHAARADRHLPRVDAVIGTTARTAVTALR